MLVGGSCEEEQREGKKRESAVTTETEDRKGGLERERKMEKSLEESK